MSLQITMISRPVGYSGVTKSNFGILRTVEHGKLFKNSSQFVGKTRFVAPQMIDELSDKQVFLGCLRMRKDGGNHCTHVILVLFTEHGYAFVVVTVLELALYHQVLY